MHDHRLNEFIVRRDIETGVQRTATKPRPVTRDKMAAHASTSCAAVVGASRPQSACTEPLPSAGEYNAEVGIPLTARPPAGAIGGVVVNGVWRTRDTSPLRPLELKLDTAVPEYLDASPRRPLEVKPESTKGDDAVELAAAQDGGEGVAVVQVRSKAFTPDLGEWALLAAPGNEKAAAKMVRNKIRRREQHKRYNSEREQHRQSYDAIDRESLPFAGDGHLIPAYYGVDRREVYSAGQMIHPSLMEQSISITVDGKKVNSYAEYAEACKKPKPMPTEQEQIILDQQYQVRVG